MIQNKFQLAGGQLPDKSASHPAMGSRMAKARCQSARPLRIRQGLWLWLLAGCAAATPLQAQTPTQTPTPTPTLSLAQALADARGNLDVSIANRAAAAAQADVLAANHAPLPQLTGKLSQMDFQHGLGPGNVLTEKRIDKSLGLDWTWERGGKRTLRTEGARRSAAAAEADRDEVQVQQLLATYGAYFDLLAAQTRVDETLAIEASAQQLADIANKRLNAGDVAVQDAARAAIEAERARADTDAARLEQQRASLALALLTGRVAEAASLVVQPDWPALDGSAAAQPPALPPPQAIDQRGDVRAGLERARAAEAALAGAQALRRSDITWGASFDHWPGTSTRQVELRLQMPLQWGYKYEGETGRAQAQLDQAQDALEKARRNAAGELQRLQAELLGAAQRAQRYGNEIVPRSRQVAARAELAYQRGALPLTDLLDARRTLRAALLDDLSARTDLAKAVGAWQLRTGAGTAGALR